MGTLNKIGKLLNWGKNNGGHGNDWVNFNTPLFKSEFGNDIFASDIVCTAINRIAEALSKCVLKSVIEKNIPQRSVTPADDELNALFGSMVNPIMTQKDFLHKIAFLTIANENCFIYPVYDEIPVNNDYVRRVYRAFYPLEGATKGVIYNNGTEFRIELSNNNNVKFDMPYSDIIHIRHNYGQHPFLGGDATGRFNVRALLKNLNVVQVVKDAIPKSVEAALSIKGVLTMKGLPEFDQRAVSRDEFEEHITDSRYGLLATSYATDFTPVNITATDIPQNIMTLIQSELLYPFGVSAGIMAGKYDDAEYSAFYQTVIEGLLISISQAFTAMIFTDGQLARGRKIKAYDRLVQNMSVERRIKVVELVKDNALLSADEQRELLGYEPNGQPTRVSLNFVDTNIINEYQLGGLAPTAQELSKLAQPNNGGSINE